MTRSWTAVDPGARETGVVTLLGDYEPLMLVAYVVVTRLPEWTDREYVEHVCREVAYQQSQALGTVDRRGHVGVEQVNPPHAWRNGEKVPINPASLIGTAMVYGAVLARFPGAQSIAPKGHGSRGRAAYPSALWGPREGDAGTGKLRHCRSAYDCALALAGRLPENVRTPRPKPRGSRGKRGAQPPLGGAEEASQAQR